MEPQFKSSFIPKKPVSPVSMRQTRSKPVGFLLVLSSVVLVATALLAGGLFGYGIYLKNDLVLKQEALKIAKRDLQPALVQEIRRVDARLRHSQQLIENHLALSPVFSLLERSTLTSVQFTNFAYVFNPEGGVTLELSGIAPSFAALALQSDVLYGNPTTYKSVEFATVNLDAEGRVIFDLNLDIDRTVVGYKNLISTTNLEDTIELPQASSTPSQPQESLTPQP